MVVKIGNQFLDDDAQPRQFVAGQALCLAKGTRGLDGLGNRPVAFEAQRQPVRI